MTRRRARHRIHGNPFNIRGEITAPSWPEVFGRDAPLAVDVGFGPGGFVLELARRRPELNVIGIEIRAHFVEGVMAAARQEDLPNVYALLGNANLHLDELFPDGALALASVNFPDPWYKKRHHKRRVVNRPWLDTLARKLRPDGVFHYVTDYEPAAREALELLADHPRFQADFEPAGEGTEHPSAREFAGESTTGIQSEREVTHLGRGEPVYRLAYRRAP